MPKLLTKTKVLNGRVEIISYERDEHTYYYRELVKGTKTYRTKKLNSSTFNEAQDEVLDVYSILRLPNTSPDYIPPKGQNREHKELKKVIQEYLKMLRDKVTSKQIKQATYDRAEEVLYKPVLRYFNQAGITTTDDIDLDTFKGYIVWRQKTATGRHNNLKRGEGLTPISLQGDLNQITKWINNWLLPRKLIKAELTTTKGFIEYPKLNPDDLLANPAINEDDWLLILDWTKKHYLNKTGRDRGLWSRNMFYNWMLISKNTGARPEELLKLKWKDVEFEDVGRENSKGEEVSKEIAHCVLKSSKTGATRISSSNCVYVFERWLKYQKDFCKLHNKQMDITPNSYVWGSPYKKGIPNSYSTYKDHWQRIREGVSRKLKGHIFSDEPYTIYSMRSTFIEDNLIQGKDIFLIAKAAGHDVKTLMKHYERIDPRKRSREMTEFQYGSTPKTIRRSSL
jgi:integrase